jgi:hypothetical protein
LVLLLLLLPLLLLFLCDFVVGVLLEYEWRSRKLLFMVEPGTSNEESVSPLLLEEVSIVFNPI